MKSKPKITGQKYQESPGVMQERGGDGRYMAQALKLARAAKGKTFPNPAVGAIIVANGKIVGSGATQFCGGPHAERVALAQAGKKSSGATLYVTLEPCCHHGRTPPCTDAIIAAEIRRVVAAAVDPNPLVKGKGIARLRAAGIAVDTGILADKAAALNEDFFWAITRKKAWITLKLACTLDGRIADCSGASQWVTGSAARIFAHELRRRHAGVAVGRATLERDDPRLTVRHLKGYSPARIVFASRAKIPLKSFFAQHAGEARTIVVVAGKGKKKIGRDTERNIEYWYTGKSKGAAHLAAFTKMAFENDITSVLVEGGQQLASSFLEAGLVNRLYILYGNKLLGNGKDGILFSKGLPINKCIYIKERKIILLDDTIAITGIPVKTK